MYELKSGTILKNTYRIVRKLSQGGFGITYLAEHIQLNRKVAIKEFLMKDYCSREDVTRTITVNSQGSAEMIQRFRNKFLKEARTIASMDHPRIVRVTDVFEENSTAYYVMEYIEGGSLQNKIDSMGYMPLAMAKKYIEQIGSALIYIHKQNINHLDVKPANVMLDKNDNVVLIDFGVSKQYDYKSKVQDSTTPVPVSIGYSPIEQYSPGGVKSFSPESDVYALGATFYKLLTGITPPPATELVQGKLSTDPLKEKGIQQYIIDAIVKAMAPRRSDRVGSVEELLCLIDGTIPTNPPTPFPIPPAPNPQPDGNSFYQRHMNEINISLVAIIIVLGTITFFQTEPGKDVLNSIGKFLTKTEVVDTTDVTPKDTIVIKEETPKDTIVIEKPVVKIKTEEYPNVAVTGTEFDKLSEYYCDYDEIDNMGYELSILRNSVYARHGYRFKEKQWRDYFNQFEWYEPLYDKVELTEIEKRNVKLIKEYEEMYKQ